VAFEAGQQRHVLAGVIGPGRGHVTAMVGGQDQHVAGAGQLEPAHEAGVDLAQRAVEALDIVAMPVDLVGLDEIREHESMLERSQQVGHLCHRAGVTGAGVLNVDADATEQLPDLAHGVDRHVAGL